MAANQRWRAAGLTHMCESSLCSGGCVNRWSEGENEGPHRVVQTLKLWTAGSPCEGDTRRALWSRGRTGSRRRRGVRYYDRRPARLFQKADGTVPDRRGGCRSRQHLTIACPGRIFSRPGPDPVVRIFA